MDGLQTMHLFAGHGGGLLADLILGHTPIVAVEWDRYACQVLRERAADGWFLGLRVWEGDVRMFDPSEYAGKVDCIHAGFPCQDISQAGKQAGVGPETRSGLYREVLRIAGVVRPKELFLENVSAIITNGLGTVLGDLTALGYDSEWLCLRASDCGASHSRDRWWLRANSTSKGLEGAHKQPIREGVRNVTPRLDKEMANTNSSGFQQSYKKMESELSKQFDSSSIQSSEIVSDAYGSQRNGERESIPDDQEHSAAWGLGWWSVESSVGRVADGVPNRAHRLKGLGNGQVPLQAAVAWKLLGGA